VIEVHPESAHDRQTPVVVRPGAGDYPRQPEPTESLLQPGDGCLCGVAVTLMLARETPCALDVVGIGLLVVETAHPEGFAVVLSFDGEQADPLGGE